MRNSNAPEIIIVNIDVPWNLGLVPNASCSKRTNLKVWKNLNVVSAVAREGSCCWNL